MIMSYIKFLDRPRISEDIDNEEKSDHPFENLLLKLLQKISIHSINN